VIHRRWPAWIMLAAYVLSTLLLHKRGNDFAGSFVIAYGPARYREGIRILSIVAASIILPFVIRNLWRNRTRRKFLLALIPLILVIDQTMISVPLERIHYVQYGILTWLCYRATGRRLPAAMMAFLIGYVDEAHQFWVLYAGDPIQYFDWNDIALNLLGVIGTLGLFLPEPSFRRPDFRRLAAIMAAWILAVVLMGFFYKPDSYLFRNDPYKGSGKFWIAETDRSYHVMNANQGMIFLGVVWILTVACYAEVPADEPEGSMSPHESITVPM